MIRGEIWLAEFGIPYGSEIGYSRKEKYSKTTKETMEEVEMGMKLVLGIN